MDSTHVSWISDIICALEDTRKDRGRWAIRNPRDAHRYLEMSWKDVERIAQTLPPEQRKEFLESLRNG